MQRCRASASLRGLCPPPADWADWAHADWPRADRAHADSSSVAEGWAAYAALLSARIAASSMPGSR